MDRGRSRTFSGRGLHQKGLSGQSTKSNEQGSRRPEGRQAILSGCHVYGVCVEPRSQMVASEWMECGAENDRWTMSGTRRGEVQEGADENRGATGDDSERALRNPSVYAAIQVGEGRSRGAGELREDGVEFLAIQVEAKTL